MAASVRLSERGKEIADRQRIQKGWNKYEDTWSQSAGTSRATLKRFWQREFIKQENFAAICRSIGLEQWEELADWETDILGSVIHSRYKLLERLSSKPNCAIYLAQDCDLPSQSLCILKKFTSYSPESRQLFEKEALVLNQLRRHPQIPTLLAYFKENEDYYLVEEYIEGETIEEEIIKRGKWQENEVIKFLQEILDILSLVHDNKVVHCNLTPNHLISRKSNQKIVLINFGGIRQTPQSDSIGERSSSEPSTDSIFYLAPEQGTGAPQFCSDVYTVGTICIQALTGLHPKKLKIDYNSGNIVWRNLVQISPQLGDFLDKMVWYDFRKRYQSAREALQELQKIYPNVINT